MALRDDLAKLLPSTSINPVLDQLNRLTKGADSAESGLSALGAGTTRSASQLTVLESSALRAAKALDRVASGRRNRRRRSGAATPEPAANVQTPARGAGRLAALRSLVNPVTAALGVAVGAGLAFHQVLLGIARSFIQERQTARALGTTRDQLITNTRSLISATSDLGQANRVAIDGFGAYRRVLDSLADPLRAGTADLVTFQTVGLGSLGISTDAFARTGGNLNRLARLLVQTGNVEADTLRRTLQAEGRSAEQIAVILDLVAQGTREGVEALDQYYYAAERHKRVTKEQEDELVKVAQSTQELNLAWRDIQAAMAPVTAALAKFAAFTLSQLAKEIRALGPEFQLLGLKITRFFGNLNITIAEFVQTGVEFLNRITRGQFGNATGLTNEQVGGQAETLREEQRVRQERINELNTQISNIYNGPATTVIEGDRPVTTQTVTQHITGVTDPQEAADLLMIRLNQAARQQG